MKIKLAICLLLIVVSVKSQSKKWENDLVVNYKVTDNNGELQNSIEIKKDTLRYVWFEKGKITSRMLVGDTALENKLIRIMDAYKFLKFKSAKLAKPGPNITFLHKKGEKQKTVAIPRNSKPESKEALFAKEFLEVILLKVFETEIKNYPR